MTAYEALLLETASRGITTVTLNRPDVRNALSQQMIRELRQAFGVLAGDTAVRGVVLTGAGDVFCAGGDLKGMQTQAVATREQRVSDATELAEMLRELDTFPKPLVGRINGSAFGGGLGLISVCDLAIAVKTAKFALTEVRLGLIPATISPYVVARLGVANSRRLMLNATEMSGDEAVRYGLLTTAVAADELDAAIDAETKKLLQCAPGAVSAAKRLIRFVSTHCPEENIPYTAAALADCWESEELASGIQAFLTKQKPPWQNEMG